MHRDWLPGDLAPLLATAGLDGAVSVQARQTLEESRWLLTLADHAPLIKGVVGWVDLRSPTVERDLAELSAHPKFVGVRHVVQDEDDRFLLSAEFVRGLRALRQFQLTYDLLVQPRQLPAAIELVRQMPEQPFALDHLAKPPIRDGKLSPWREQICELAAFPNVVCKLSGMVTEADHARWKAADFQPFLEVVCEAFGPRRLMFGSDWPVCLLAASYAQVHGLVADYVRALAPPDAAQVMGETAVRFYRLKQRRA